MAFTVSGVGSSFLSFHKGDLILLEDGSTGESVMNSGWCVGKCERTGEKGDFPAETVYVIPALNKPPDEMLVNTLNLFSYGFLIYWQNNGLSYLYMHFHHLKEIVK